MQQKHLEYDNFILPYVRERYHRCFPWEVIKCYHLMMRDCIKKINYLTSLERVKFVFHNLRKNLESTISLQNYNKLVNDVIINLSVQLVQI